MSARDLATFGELIIERPETKPRITHKTDVRAEYPAHFTGIDIKMDQFLLRRWDRPEIG